MSTQQEHSVDQQENEQLRVENTLLKKNLEKEEFLHKTLYKQWNELNGRMSATAREFKQFKSRNLFYKYSFYLILFLIIPAYYFLSSGKGNERIAAVTKAIPPPSVTTNETQVPDQDTIQLPQVKVEKEPITQPDTIQLKLAITNKPVVLKPLPDSVQYLIYWEGWDAYVEKTANPYKNSPQKYEVWIKGWKDAEKDDKKQLTKNSPDTLNQLSGSDTSEKQ